MKYVYAREYEINRTIPSNVYHRLILGSLIAFLWTILFCGYLGNPDSDFMFVFFLIVIPPIVAFILIFFAMRTLIAVRSIKTRVPQDIIESPDGRPFYSSQCPHCHTLIDYQSADLAFRLWFIKGYVECPCCGKPIRHNKEKNHFIPHRYPMP